MSLFRKKSQAPMEQPESNTKETSPEMRQYMQQFFNETFGFRGPPVVVAITNETHPGMVAWAAVPSWAPDHEVALAMTGNHPGIETFAVDIDNTLPGLWLPLRDLFATNEVGERGLTIGASQDGEWLTWELPFPPPCTPPISGHPRSWSRE